jgi:hypothetical protein
MDIGFSAAADTLETALRYAAAKGLRVFPLQQGTKRLFGGTNGANGATTDAERVRQMWGRFPNADIGMALSDELGAVDVDQKSEEDGEATLVALAARHGPLARDCRLTPIEGRHLIFRTANPQWLSLSVGNA